jgi:hypothetical protein
MKSVATSPQKQQKLIVNDKILNNGNEDKEQKKLVLYM